MIRHDLYCKKCDEIERNVWVESGKFPHCSCGAERVWVPFQFTTFEWGQPRYIKSLDRTFGSRSELQTYLKDNGLAQAESADKHHGARNESHLGLGKRYSYRGMKTNPEYAETYGKSHKSS
jgi:hypothetical protein